MNIRTDLAFEARDFYLETAQEETLDGVTYVEEKIDDVLIKRIDVTTKEAAQAMEKSMGYYVTAHVDHIEYQSDYAGIARVLAKELRAMLSVKETDSVLVVGLGNRAITADALGPKVVSGLVVSRHLKEQMPELSAELNRVSAIAPGVLGITGIETGEIIGGICDKMHPTHIIAIDALASAGMERIANTIQMADSGIVPGSGVNNHRNALTYETLGIPVIAIGVPTVVSIHSIVREAVSLMQANAPLADEKPLNDYLALHAQMVVTPKGIDTIMEKTSKIIATAINMALHPKLSLVELENFL